jgi:hypothetical protein
MKTTLLMALGVISLVAPLTSCREKGPGERAGEKMDRAADNIKDAVNPKGPGEKMGEKIDKATGN